MAASRIRPLITRLRDLLNLPATVQAIARQNHEELRSLRVALNGRGRFADKWAQAVEIGVAAGIARFDAKGVLRIAKSDGAADG